MKWIQIACVVLLGGCSSLETGSSAPGTAYAWAFLKTGPAELDDAAMAEAMQGHFANMGRLAEEGLLIVAGPLPAPRVDPLDRGIFLLDVADLERARELCGTDPAVAAGVLAAEVHPFHSPSRLREYLGLYFAASAEREAAGEEGFVGRAYVLATAEDVDAAAWVVAALAEEGVAIFHGELGEGDATRTLLALDVPSVDEARTLLAFHDPDGTVAWKLLPWYASDVLADLPR